MSQVAPGSASSEGPVLLGVIDAGPEEAAIGRAFAEADDRGVALVVVLTAAVPAGEDRAAAELIERWSQKYPGVVVTTSVRRDIDAVVTLAAASRGCAILVVREPSSVRSGALVRALSRRACCPVVVAAREATSLAARMSGVDHQVRSVATGPAQGGSTATGQSVRPMSSRTVSPRNSSPVAGPLRDAVTTRATSPLSAIKARTTSRSCRISRSATPASMDVR